VADGYLVLLYLVRPSAGVTMSRVLQRRKAFDNTCVLNTNTMNSNLTLCSYLPLKLTVAAFSIGSTRWQASCHLLVMLSPPVSSASQRASLPAPTAAVPSFEKGGQDARSSFVFYWSVSGISGTSPKLKLLRGNTSVLLIEQKQCLVDFESLNGRGFQKALGTCT
jgi:hypothetical protein